MLDRITQPGRYLPNIAVEQVKLYNGAGPVRSTRNPNIRRQSEPRQRDQYANIKVVPVIDPSPKGTGASGMYVLIRLSMTDSVEHPTWSVDDNILKYVKVRLTQNTNPEKITAIAAGQSFSETEEKIEFNLLEMIQMSSMEKNSTISKWTIDIDFGLNTNSPDHLSYIAYTYFDLLALSTDFNADLASSNVLNSKINIERVIENKEVVENSVYYIDQNKKVWAGLVHVEKNQIRTGLPTDRKIAPLRSVSGPNIKIIDFRALEQFSDNLSVVQPTRVGNSEFSELFLSSDPEGRARFGFVVDFKKYLALNSQLGGFIDRLNDRQLSEVLDNSAVTYLRVRRRRIKSEPESRLGTADVEYFSSEEVDVVVAASGEARYRGLMPLGSVYEDRDWDGNDETLIGTVQENIIYSKSTGHTRYFSVVDEDLGRITRGLFQYGVEFNFKDGMIYYVNQKVADLLQQVQRLRNYRNDFTNFLQRKQETASAFFARLVVGDKRDNFVWIKIPAIIEEFFEIFFNINLERIRNDLIQNLHPLNVTLEYMDRVIAVLDEVTNVLLTTLSDIQINNNSNLGDLRSSAYGAVGQGNKNILKLYWFNEIVDANLNKQSSYNYLSLKDTGGLNSISRVDYIDRAKLEVSQYFKSTNTEISLATKDKIYLPVVNMLEEGIRSLTPESVVIREKTHELKDISWNSDIYNDIKAAVLQENLGLRADLDKLSDRDKDKRFYRSDVKQNLLVKNDKILQNMGVIVRSVSKQEISSKESLNVMSDNVAYAVTDSTKEVDTRLVDLPLQSLAASTFIADRIKNKVRKVGVANDMKNLFDLKKSDNIVDSIDFADKTSPSTLGGVRISGEKEQAYIRNLPLQIKHLMFSSLDDGGKIVKNNMMAGDNLERVENTGIYDFNYRSVRQVEILEDFQDGQTTWVPLTLERLGRDSSSDLVARTTSFEDGRMNIGMPSGLQLPMNNQNFVIEGIGSPLVNFSTRNDILNNLIATDNSLVVRSLIDRSLLYTTIPVVGSVNFLGDLVELKTICNFEEPEIFIDGIDPNAPLPQSDIVAGLQDTINDILESGGSISLGPQVTSIVADLEPLPPSVNVLEQGGYGPEFMAATIAAIQDGSITVDMLRSSGFTNDQIIALYHDAGFPSPIGK